MLLVWTENWHWNSMTCALFISCNSASFDKDAECSLTQHAVNVFLQRTTQTVYHVRTAAEHTASAGAPRPADVLNR